MRIRSKQGMLYDNDLDNIENDEMLLQFIKKTIDEVLSERLNTKEKQANNMQQNFHRLHITNK